MDRTWEFWNTFRKHRSELGAIWNRYDAAVAKLDPYKGSQAYNDEVKEAEKVRDSEIAELRMKTSQTLSSTIAGMKKSALGRPMVTPTAEQLNLLSVLKMRESISKDELTQAARSLESCPACLSVIDEIAAKNGYLGFHSGKEGTGAIMQHIDSLFAAGKKLLKLERPNTRREQIARHDVHSADYQPGALEAFSVDRDFENENDILSYCGYVSDIEGFRAAVNAD